MRSHKFGVSSGYVVGSSIMYMYIQTGLLRTQLFVYLYSYDSLSVDNISDNISDLTLNES